MAVLSNTMMQGTAAISGGGGDAAYQIEKSLRFNDDDAPSLQQQFKKGNTRIFTLSTWVKFTKTDVNIIGEWDNTYDGLRFRIDSGGSICFQQVTSNGGGAPCRLVTAGRLRDYSAWYHIVVAVDTTQATAADRVKIYVNGKQWTAFTAGGFDIFPTQYMEWEWNAGDSNYTKSVGHWKENNNNYSYDGYLADVYHIDGLALSPAAFGSFDSTGVWVPSSFSLPTPNDGTTWSDSSSDNGVRSGGTWANLFDGDTTTLVTIDKSTSYGVALDNQTITCNASVGVWTITGSSTPTMKVTNTDDSVYIFDGVNNGSWTDFKHSGTIKKIEIAYLGGSGSANSFYGLSVDGVPLVDGQTDETDRTKTWPGVNNGTKWSSYLTAAGSTLRADGNAQGPDKGFDGDESTYSQNNSGGSNPNSQTFTPPGGLAYTSKVEIYINNTANTAAINSGSAQTMSAGWNTIATGSGSITTIVVSRPSTSGCSFHGIRVDGVVLINSTVDNSFHLKFNDTSRNSALGKDSLNGKIEDATGGLPIYNTSDYGDTKVSGYRADSNKANLVLAIPGDVLTDVSDVSDLRNSGSAKVTDDNGDCAVNTDTSRFYGSAIKFDGGSDYLEVGNNSDYDFDGDFCAEAWVYVEAYTNDYASIFGFSHDGDQHGWNILMRNNGAPHINVDMNYTDVAGTVSLKTWTHLALVRSGSGSGNVKCYINGIASSTTLTETDATGTPSSTECYIGSYPGYEAGRAFNGYIQDVRIYKGAAKYTANFTVPNRNDFAVTNLSLTSVPAGIQGINHCVVDNYANQHYANTNGNPSEAWIGTVAEVAAGGFWGTDRIYWVDLGEAKTVEKFVWNLTSDGNSGAGTGSFIMWYTDNPSSTGSTRCSGGCTVNTANTFSGSITGDMVVTHDWGSGNAITNRYIGLSNGSGGASTHFKLTGYTFTDANDGPAALEPCSLLDSPTNYLPTDGNDALGGVTRGNYCTLNPLSVSSGWTFSQGNLKVVSSGSYGTVKGTIGMTSGKWYAEMTAQSDNTAGAVGVVRYDHTNTYVGGSASDIGYGYLSDGRKATTSDTRSTYGATWATGDVIGIALDLSGSTGTVTFYKNGATQGQAFTLTTADGPWFFAACDDSNASHTTQLWNFGQRAFEDEAPTGHKCLCTQNLDDLFSGAEVNDPSYYFNVATWSGDDVNGKNIVTSPNFAPDLLWIKERNQAYTIGHRLYDRARGAGVNKHIDSSSTAVEGAENDETYGYVSAFTSNGFTATEGSADIDYVNKGGNNYVAWTWDAGTAGAANNDGSTNIASPNQWKNATAGFSITKYTGTGANATVGHGLGAKPTFHIIKRTNETADWRVYSESMGNNKSINLAETGAMYTVSHYQDTDPTNTVISITSDANVNEVDDTYIMYTWTAIPGYSAFGTYEGNNNADGPFIYTGFRVRYLLMKDIDASKAWVIKDTARDSDNTNTSWLEANSSGAEQSTGDVDFLSNGFKIRTTVSDANAADTFIYAAFAEHPFKTARAV